MTPSRSRWGAFAQAVRCRAGKRTLKLMWPDDSVMRSASDTPTTHPIKMWDVDLHVYM